MTIVRILATATLDSFAKDHAVLFIADEGRTENGKTKYDRAWVMGDLYNIRYKDEFNHIVVNPEYHPLFVYDRDGSLAGALWFLHFRTVEQLPDEQARARAKAIGFREDSQRSLWQAVQQYLREQPR